MNTPLSSLLAEKPTSVLAVSPEETVLDAVQKMNEIRVGSVLVLRNGKLTGIFTERDVLQRIVATGRDPKTTLVKEVMTSDIVTVESSTTVTDTMELVSQKKLRHLPVVDEGELVGLISSGDLNRHVTRILQSEAGTLMTYITGGAFEV